MKHILVAMDLSPLSDRAFERAVQLAEAHEARLTLAHVVDQQILSYGDDASDLQAVLTNNAVIKLGRHWSGMPESVASRFRHIIRIGSPWETILTLASEYSCDLIVLGLHRVNPLKDMFIGTTAERIIRNSTVPVLVVKDKPEGPYRNVIVGTDFSPFSSHALQAALALVPDAEFQLLHVFETPFPSRIHFGADELEAWRQERVDKATAQAKVDLERFVMSHAVKAKPAIRTLVERGEVGVGIAAMVKQYQPDLLVLGTHGRSGISGALMGSVAVSFLNDPPVDVLVAR